MYRLKQTTLLLGDLVCLYLGLFFALLVRQWGWQSYTLDRLISPMTILFVLSIVILFIVGAYDLDQAKNTRRFYNKIIGSALIWIMIGVLYFYINTFDQITPKTILLLTALFGFGAIAFWRFLYNRFFSTYILLQNIIFAGLTPEVKELIKIIQDEPQRGLVVKGIITDQDLTQDETFKNIIVGGDLKSILPSNKFAENYLIVISPQRKNRPELAKELYKGLFRSVGVVDLVRFFEDMTGRIPPFTFSEGWFIANLQEQNKKIYDRAKLITDYGFTMLMGIFFIITFPIVALMIKISSHGPIFFKQKRVGKLGKVFMLYKYRTMKVLSADGSAEIDGPQFSSDKDIRITMVGKILRKTRLDEIPQFINIAKREMSIIGPRPERPEFVDQLLTTMPYYALRHLIKPGITGWAQIKHGYTGSINANLRKLEYDLFYIKNRGPLLDVAILLRTINIVARFAGK